MELIASNNLFVTCRTIQLGLVKQQKTAPESCSRSVLQLPPIGSFFILKFSSNCSFRNLFCSMVELSPSTSEFWRERQEAKMVSKKMPLRSRLVIKTSKVMTITIIHPFLGQKRVLVMFFSSCNDPQSATFPFSFCLHQASLLLSSCTAKCRPQYILVESLCALSTAFFFFEHMVFMLHLTLIDPSFGDGHICAM